LPAIAADAQVEGVITSTIDQTHLKHELSEIIPHARWLCTDDMDDNAAGWGGRRISPDDIAFLQYTSGSTGTPKGVVITHANLMHNQRAIQSAMSLSEESLFVGWLPLFHDMGLIGNVMQSLYLGIGCVLMPPMAFLQKPVRWLKAISSYRATISGAPNFAFDLCVDKVTPEQQVGLDLESWSIAFNGSEPVRAETFERFVNAFRSIGLRASSCYPCYGMAEATLLVSGVTAGREPDVLEIDFDLLRLGAVKNASGAGGRSARLVSCGKPRLDVRVIIVDPELRQRCADDVIGEIWVAGGSVAAGYYNKPALTKKTFGAFLTNGEGPFLRTGDLGFMRDGHLYITGRLKDVIIVRGRNYYPQDLESTACKSNPLLTGIGAAVVIEKGGETSIVIVHEVKRQGFRTNELNAVAADVREAIAFEHGLRVSRVILVKPGAVPRTSSGKVRRSKCRELVENGSFDRGAEHAAFIEERRFL
jgi:acyl-CoA synthetase (AMP-forming)/AMP-acid ligase II